MLRRFLDYKDLANSIQIFKKRLGTKKEAGDLFGQEIGGKFAAVLGNINQTYDGKELYPSLEKRRRTFYIL